MPKLTPEELDAAAERWFAHVDRVLKRRKQQDSAETAAPADEKGSERLSRLQVAEQRRKFRERFGA